MCTLIKSGASDSRNLYPVNSSKWTSFGGGSVQSHEDNWIVVDLINKFDN